LNIKVDAFDVFVFIASCNMYLSFILRAMTMRKYAKNYDGINLSELFEFDRVQKSLVDGARSQLREFKSQSDRYFQFTAPKKNSQYFNLTRPLRLKSN
jgi:hypothetical protein